MFKINRKSIINDFIDGDFIERVVDYKEKTHMKTWEMLKDRDPKYLAELKCVFHRECYSEVSNVSKIKRLKNDFADLDGSDTVSSEKIQKRLTLSLLDSYKKEQCFFCQDDTTQPLVNFRTFNRSDMIKEAIEKSNNETLRIRFNSFCDAHAGDVKYHLPCMINNVDRVLYCSKRKTEVDPDDLIRCAVEEELVTPVDVGIKSGSIFEMKRIFEAYIKTVQERGGNEHRSEKTLKKRVKKLLQDEIDFIVFKKSVQRNLSEKEYSRFVTDAF